MNKLFLFSVKCCTISLFIFVISINLNAQVVAKDSLALVALYDSTKGANWTTRTNWLGSEPVSNWYGIIIKNNRVTEIILSNNNLNGTIPVEFWNLDSLESLNFYNNQLGGIIPPEIENLSGLKILQLGSNEFNGSIPNEITNLTQLTVLVFYDNQMTDSIPSTIGNLTNLEYLNIGLNQLTGSIPSEIGNLTDLSNLNLIGNQLSGLIPPEIGNLINLTSLYLSNNELTAIPDEIGSLSKLYYLYLDQNQLSGTIPLILGDLTSLVQLSLGDNQFNGSIPAVIGKLINLQSLVFQNNQLGGSIPSGLFNLPKLSALLLSGNQFTGAIPENVNSLKELANFYIADNQFTDLPSLDSLTKMTYLKTENNKFTFEDIEPNIGIAAGFFTYSPQDSVGTQIDTLLDPGDILPMSVSVGGSANQYQWMKNGIDIEGADSSSYTLLSIDSSDTGSYICRITNTIATDLTLYSRPVNLVLPEVVRIAKYSTKIPRKYELHQNFPNPFNPKTIINYQLPMNSDVELAIYNLFGQKVVTLVDKKQAAGSYQVQWDGSNYASGVYLYTLKVADIYRQTRKLVLLK